MIGDARENQARMVGAENDCTLFYKRASERLGEEVSSCEREEPKQGEHERRVSDQ